MISVTWFKSVLILLPCVAGIALFMGNIFPEIYQNRIGVNLGLDLQGGVHLLLEVDTQELAPSYMKRLAKDLKLNLRRKYKKNVGVRVLKNDLVITIPSWSSSDRMAEAVSEFASIYTESIGTSEFAIRLGDSNSITLSLTEAKKKQMIESAMDRSVEIVRRRVDAVGVAEPNIQKQGSSRILLQLPGYSDSSKVRDLLGQVAKLDLYMVNEEAIENNGLEAANTIWLNQRNSFYQMPLFDDVEVAGEDIEDAKVLYEGGRPVVTFALNSVGATAFARATRKNVGKRMAIVLDNEVVSSPVISVPILDGRASIEGDFTFEEATALAITLRSGALPAPMKVLEERTVGPDLGSDSVQAGKLGGIVAMCLVALFIMIYYRVFGFIAALVLAINVVSIFGVLSLFGATLTLPGIAGIVLTIGMAVDANILIFERIKEELALGRTPFDAINVGYKQALRAIWDSNITTGIVALILIVLATGPVQGFGLTLIIGIMTSIYSSTLVTRLFMSIFWKWCNPKNLSKALGVG